MVNNIFPIFFWVYLMYVSFWAFFIPQKMQAQKTSIELGDVQIAKNQAFSIAISVEDEALQTHSRFPQIDGLVMRGSSSSSTTKVIDGQRSVINTIIQYYYPKREGEIVVPAFSMQINGKTTQCPGTKLRVSPANPDLEDVLEDPLTNVELELSEAEDDAFLGLTVSSDKVYLGQGLTVMLAFYAAVRTNRARLQFHDVGTQLVDILKSLRPAHCWEEDFNISEIQQEQITIAGKEYYQYKIYQATFYPLTTQSIVFPKVGLKMIKYKDIKNAQSLTLPDVSDFKTYYTQPRQVAVLPLPMAKKSNVPVGAFQLRESLPKLKFNTGERISLTLTLGGEGNLASVTMLEPQNHEHIDIYQGDMQQTILRGNNRVSGTKIFTYNLIAKAPGQYPLRDLFSFVYFNPAKQQYDTLSPKFTLEISGDPLPTQTDRPLFQGLYTRISTDSNEFAIYQWQNFIRLLTNIVWVGLLAFTLAFLWDKKRRKI